MLPSRDDIEELLTEPTEVTRWGIALASLVIVLIGVLLERATA